MPGFSWVFPFIRISKADLSIAHQHQTIGVPIEMGLGEMLLGLRNVFVPNFRRFIDVAVAIENREILFSAFSRVRHNYLRLREIIAPRRQDRKAAHLVISTPSTMLRVNSGRNLSY